MSVFFFLFCFFFFLSVFVFIVVLLCGDGWCRVGRVWMAGWVRWWLERGRCVGICVVSVLGNRFIFDKITHLYPLGTFSTFHYMFYISLSGYNSRTIQDIKFKFLVFLSFVEATTCVNLQSARCTGFKDGIFRIRPASLETSTAHNNKATASKKKSTTHIV